jgi:hypothetical protein
MIPADAIVRVKRDTMQALQISRPATDNSARYSAIQKSEHDR